MCDVLDIFSSLEREREREGDMDRERERKKERGRHGQGERERERKKEREKERGKALTAQWGKVGFTERGKREILTEKKDQNQMYNRAKINTMSVHDGLRHS